MRTIYNGFDRDDDAQTPVSISDTFTLTYLGVLSKIQNPEQFWQVLGELVKEDEEFSKKLKIKLIGQIDNSVIRSIEEQGLSGYVALSPYVPHDQVSEVHRSSTLLLLFLMPDSEPRAKGLLTGKLFEYMASGRPILCIGPEDGDAAHILKETHAGQTVNFEDKKKMKEVIKDLYQKYLKNGLPSNESQEVEKYSRRALTGEYGKLLDNTIME